MYLSQDSIINSVLPLLQQLNPLLTGQELTEFLETSKSGPKQQKYEKPLTRQQAADYLSVSLSTVNRYMKNGQLTPVHIGPRLVRITPASVYALMSR